MQRIHIKLDRRGRPKVTIPQDLLIRDYLRVKITKNAVTFRSTWNHHSRSRDSVRSPSSPPRTPSLSPERFNDVEEDIPSIPSPRPRRSSNLGAQPPSSRLYSPTMPSLQGDNESTHSFGNEEEGERRMETTEDSSSDDDMEAAFLNAPTSPELRVRSVGVVQSTDHHITPTPAEENQEEEEPQPSELPRTRIFRPFTFGRGHWTNSGRGIRFGTPGTSTTTIRGPTPPSSPNQ